MNVIFDTNIVLDLLLDRQPFADHASYLISKVERDEITGLLCATTITTIHYLLSKHTNSKNALKSINTLMNIFEIAQVNRRVIERAMASEFSDFEDAVLHESAAQAGAEYIITRNIKDFKRSELPVFLPMEFLNMMDFLN